MQDQVCALGAAGSTLRLRPVLLHGHQPGRQPLRHFPHLGRQEAENNDNNNNSYDNNYYNNYNHSQDKYVLYCINNNNNDIANLDDDDYYTKSDRTVG